MNQNDKNKAIANSLGYDGLSEIQARAVELIELEGKTKMQTAEILGVHRNTIGAWDKLDSFKTARQKCAAERTRQTLSYIRSHAKEAVEELWNMAKANQNSDKRVAKEIYMFFAEKEVGKTPQRVEVDDSRGCSDDYDINAALERLKQTPKEDE